jgi:Lectin C-type domain
MRVIMFPLMAFAVLATTGCLRKTEFQCAEDTACGATGRCESTGFCSFADGGCSTGRRYDSSAGSLAGQCTGGGNITDGGDVDTSMPPSDGATPDTPNGNCPAGYVALTGVPGHLYKVVPTTANWSAQHQACRLTSLAAYLAVPDTIEELTAMDAVAGATNYWVGITDSATEGTWLNVLGAAQTFLPWQPPAPDNAAGGQGEDCVEALSALHKFNDERCNTSLPAICECNP